MSEEPITGEVLSPEEYEMERKLKKQKRFMEMYGGRVVVAMYGRADFGSSKLKSTGDLRKAQWKKFKHMFGG